MKLKGGNQLQGKLWHFTSFNEANLIREVEMK
jgi:hypothetical protein